MHGGRAATFGSAMARPFGVHVWRPRWRRAGPLARDVTIVLLIKALALLLVWGAFFREPAAPGMSMEVARVADRVVTPAPAPGSPDAGR